MWEERKEHCSTEKERKKKGRYKVMKEKVCKRNDLFIHSHISVPTICQQTVLDICGKSVNKRDREDGQDRSHQEGDI